MDDPALSAYRLAVRAVEGRPQDAGAWRTLARRAHAVGEVRSAGVAAQRATRLAPEHSGGWQLLGEAQVRLSMLREPIACFERAVALDADNVGAWILLGQTRMNAGDLDGAEEALGQALALDARHPDAVASRAHLCLRQRRPDEAEALLAPVLALGHPGVAWAWGRLWQRTDPARGIAAVRDALPEARGFTRIRLVYLLADLLDATGDVDAAFAAYREANEAHPARFDPDVYDADIDRRMATWTRPACAAPPEVPRYPRAVWIVGLPRSGTSLLEQMLGAHPEVHPGGERPALAILERRWAADGSAVHAGALGPLAGVLQRNVDSVGPGARYVTDKLPDNLLRLGLAARLAPGSTVIVVRRDPVDTLWSCYRQSFGAGFAWTTRLEWLARVYRAQQRLLAHYRDVVPLRWVDVDYGDLVTAPEAELRRILGALDLDLAAGCLRPHEQDRHVATASSLEVQEPVHTSSVGRHAPYARHLAPLREGLLAGSTP